MNGVQPELFSKYTFDELVIKKNKKLIYIPYNFKI